MPCFIQGSGWFIRENQFGIRAESTRDRIHCLKFPHLAHRLTLQSKFE
jgi:hypothetical protein